MTNARIPTNDDFADIDRLIDELRANRGGFAVEPEQRERFAASAARLRMLASAAQIGGGLGECRRDRPFKPLRPVLKTDGLYWVCSHDPEHEINVTP